MNEMYSKMEMYDQVIILKQEIEYEVSELSKKINHTSNICNNIQIQICRNTGDFTPTKLKLTSKLFLLQ